MKNDLKKFDDKSLIDFIERTTSENTDELVNAKEELTSRNLSAGNIEALALDINAKIAYEMIMKENVSDEGLNLHKSKFLNENEIREIYKEQLEKYIAYKNQFRFNVWSYAIGGG